MVYRYIAYRESGELVKGRLNARTEEAAADLLSYAGYKVVNLKPFAPFFSLGKLTDSFFRVKPGEVILFYRQLAMLLESGIDIVSCLEMLRDQAANRALKSVLTDVIADLRAGNQLSATLARHPSAFSPMYCRLIAVGEQTGGLETVLKQIADYMEKEAATAKNVKNALMYPVITSIVTVIVIIILVTYALPAFGDLYNSLGVELPAPTKMLIDTTNQLKTNGLFITMGVLLILILGMVYVRTSNGRYKWDEFLLTMPVLGRINHLSELAQYCQSLSLLFRAGLPLTEAVGLVIQSSDNKAMAKALSFVQHDMVKGEGLSIPMAKSKLFLPMMVQMVKVGEETGNLDTTLQAVSRSYEAEAEDKTKSLIALIQPAMTLLIGVIIGLIALSLTSAMYSLYGKDL